MAATPRASLDDGFAAFEKRFDRCFLRVYTYVFARVVDHATAQRLTRDVLTRSLAELLDAEEPELDIILLRASKQLLAEGPRTSGG